MMKKFLIALATVAVLVLGVWAETWTDPDTGYTWTYRINGETAEIYGRYSYGEWHTAIWPKPTGAVAIPATLGGKPVTSIGDDAFYDCKGLTSVTIPNSVTSINKDVFYNCTNLTSVTIPDSVSSIGESAFGNCSALTSVTIPDSVASIGQYAFSGCSALTSVMLGGGLTSIGYYAFHYCNGIKDVTVPQYVCDSALYRMFPEAYQSITNVVILNSVTNIGNYAFYGCSALMSVTIPDCVTRIGDYAFYDCSALTSVTIPDGVTNVGDYAFGYCDALTNIVIPDKVTNIGNGTFCGCSGLASVTIPNGVTNIGASAFYYCSALTSATIPDSVTSIGSETFWLCRNLKVFPIPPVLTEIGAAAFYGCTGLADDNGFVVVKETVFAYNDEREREIRIPEGVRRISQRAFQHSVGIRSVSIPDTVQTVEAYAFAWCTNLASVTVSGTNTTVAASAFSGCDAVESVSLPLNIVNSGLAQIFPDAYAGIGEVDVTEGGETGLASGVFAGCTMLRSVSLPEETTEIGDGAFRGCTNLTEVTIPAAVTNIGESVFLGCSSLTNVSMSEAVASIGSRSFSACTALETLSFPANIETLGTRLFEGDTNLVSVLLPERLQQISDDLFNGCEAITTAALPSGIKGIGARAFRNCRNLASVTVPDGVKTIGLLAFSGCTNLVSVTVPGSVEQIGGNAFLECGKIETAIVPAVAVSGPIAGTFPDSWQTSLREVVVAEGADEIAANAFANCKKLQRVTLPASVTFLGDNAFNMCSALAEVHFLGDAPSVPEILYQGTPARLVSYVQEDSIGWNGGIDAILPDAWPVSLEVGAIRADARAIKHESGSLSVPTVCTVQFDARGGRVSPSSRQVMTSTAVGVLPVPVRSDYSFQGWFTMPGGGVAINKDTIVSGNVTYYAHWMFSGPSFIVTFDANGGTGGTEMTIESGAAIGELPVPEFEGHTFEGWFTATDGGSRISADTIVSASSTYYAQWSVNHYVVTFDANGGEGGWSSNMVYGAAIVAPMVTRTGYTFTGWSPSVAATMPASNVTFAATWTAVPPPEPTMWTVVFDLNYADATERVPPVVVTNGCTIGELPSATRSGYTFDGWFTAASGGSRVSDDTVITANVTLYARWTELTPDPDPTPDPEPTPVPDPDPVVTQQVWTVSFDANGGAGAMAAQVFTNGVAQTLGANGFTRFGYEFLGWATSRDGEVVYVDGEAITVSSGMTLYAQWDEIIAGVLDTSFAKAQTVNGALYKGYALAGTVQVKVGKANRKGLVKVSATATLIVDGKAKKITAKAVSIDARRVGDNAPYQIAFKAPIGEMAFEMAADGSFTLKNGSYLMAEATIGGALKGGSHGTFRMDGFDLAVPGELLDDLLPNEESFSVSNGKWAFAKAATVKWAKDRVTKEYGLVVDNTKGKTNLSGLKLTYAAKTGQFKGSFKVYALEEKNGKTKLVKYTVNVIGFVVDGVGYGEASCKKIAGGPWAVTVE